MLKLLNVVDEHTREAPGIVAAWSITAATVATPDDIVDDRDTAPE